VAVACSLEQKQGPLVSLANVTELMVTKTNFGLSVSIQFSNSPFHLFNPKMITIISKLFFYGIFV
jgi:hypothetical protein